jgi:hypothetical protein
VIIYHSLNFKNLYPFWSQKSDCRQSVMVCHSMCMNTHCCKICHSVQLQIQVLRWVMAQCKRSTCPLPQKVYSLCKEYYKYILTAHHHLETTGSQCNVCVRACVLQSVLELFHRTVLCLPIVRRFVEFSVRFKSACSSLSPVPPPPPPHPPHTLTRVHVFREN